MPGQIGVAFDAVAGVERDLLIRKLFTNKRTEVHVPTSAWTVTAGLIQSIWVAPSTGRQEDDQQQVAASPDERLPARRLVMPPRAHTGGLN